MHTLSRRDQLDGDHPQRIASGRGSEADIDLLDRISRNMSGTALCALADACVGPVRSLVLNFRHELEACINEGGSPYPERRYFGNGSKGVEA